jgi:pilus assembly protein FimV
MHLGWTPHLIAVVALFCSGGAAALGFGAIRSSVVLGQPLNLAVPVSLADGETLTSECASAEVLSGDSRLPPGSVRIRVTQGRDATESVLRISTSSVVEEPVLTVTVSAGCPTRLSRTLVLLADPPLVTTADTPAASPALASVAPPPATAAAPVESRPVPARATRPATPARSTRSAPSQPARAALAGAAPAASAVARTPAAAAPRPVARVEAKPRLRLDSGQVSLSDAAVLAAQEQASAARATAVAAEAAASAAGERMRGMEAEMARLRAEAKATSDALLQVRQQMALDRAQREQTSPLVMALLGLAAALAALAAWLGWRLRKTSQAPRNEADWWDRGPESVAASMAPPPASDFLPSQRSPAAARVPSAPAPWADSIPSRSGEVDVLIAPATLPAPTVVTIPPASPSVAPAQEQEANRAMSVDEQIDLEQQADFFIALGHDDAAIDLLMAHMRSTGGGSPLPFLKLLEIHRRRDQREAYERTRVRFNQRFNSVAPDWQADPKAGRTLDDYPLAMGRIQRAWPAPLDAMAELEALLFRRGSGAELFDLPAYQEVLFLFQMARDLHQAEDSGADDVDVLLPIGGRSAPLAAAEGTIVLRPEFNDGEPVSLDLDLSTDHGDDLSAAEPEPEPEPLLSLENLADPSPEAPPEDDFWGSNPDARPTR